MSTAGIITTIAGGPIPGFSGDGGPARARCFWQTTPPCTKPGNVYIAEGINQARIRKIDAVTDTISTIAGTGVQGFSGDGGHAVNARLALPQGVAVDKLGKRCICHGFNGRVRKIGTDGIITT